MLEGVVERIVWRLARIDDNRGVAITTHMGVGARLDTACALANLDFAGTPTTERLESLVQPILRLYGRRNVIVHSRLVHFRGRGGRSDTTLRLEYKARGEVRKRVADSDLEEYRTVSRDILAVANELLLLLHAFINMSANKYDTPPP
jgi:hypothetical protein